MQLHRPPRRDNDASSLGLIRLIRTIGGPRVFGGQPTVGSYKTGEERGLLRRCQRDTPRALRLLLLQLLHARGKPRGMYTSELARRRSSRPLQQLPAGDGAAQLHCSSLTVLEADARCCPRAGRPSFGCTDTCSRVDEALWAGVSLQLPVAHSDPRVSAAARKPRALLGR